MTWGHPQATEHWVRIHILDREGIPYPAPIVGQGAHIWSVVPELGEPDIELDPQFPKVRRTGKMRLHLTTYTDQIPSRTGLGRYAVEVFTPGPQDDWLYILFPQVHGQLNHLRAGGRLSVFGPCQANRHLGELVKGFPGDREATMLTGSTFDRPQPLVQV